MLSSSITVVVDRCRGAKPIGAPGASRGVRARGSTAGEGFDDRALRAVVAVAAARRACQASPAFRCKRSMRRSRSAIWDSASARTSALARCWSPQRLAGGRGFPRWKSRGRGRGGRSRAGERRRRRSRGNCCRAGPAPAPGRSIRNGGSSWPIPRDRRDASPICMKSLAGGQLCLDLTMVGRFRTAAT